MARPSRLGTVRAGFRARRFRADVALVLTFKRRAAILARLAGCGTRYGAATRAEDFASLTHNAYAPAVIVTWGDEEDERAVRHV